MMKQKEVEQTALSIRSLASASIWEDASWGYVIMTWRSAPAPVVFALSPVKRRANNVSTVGTFIVGAIVGRLLQKWFMNRLQL